MSALLILAVLYFVPTIIALRRGHRQALSIALLNFFLGWTIVGWVCALVWSATAKPQPIIIQQVGPAQ
jgi:T4 superinfection immunity protein